MKPTAAELAANRDRRARDLWIEANWERLVLNADGTTTIGAVR